MAIMPQNAVESLPYWTRDIPTKAFPKTSQLIFFTLDLHEWLQHGQSLQHQHNVPDSGAASE